MACTFSVKKAKFPSLKNLYEFGSCQVIAHYNSQSKLKGSYSNVSNIILFTLSKNK